MSYSETHTYTVTKRDKNMPISKEVFFYYSGENSVNTSKTQFWKFDSEAKHTQPYRDNRKIKEVNELAINYVLSRMLINIFIIFQVDY